MAKELYIYSPLYRYTAETANKELSRINDSEELTIRLNSPGGEVNAGFAIISKLQERKTPVKAIIDGEAASMAAFMLVFFGNVVANETSQIMFHKAAFASWYEPTADEQASLKAMNALFEQKMRAKVQGKPGAEEFLSKLFEAEVRNNVNVSPQEALTLGIVDEVRTLQPTALLGAQMVAMVEEGQTIQAVNNTPRGDNNKSKSMNLEQFKAEYPALYAQILEQGKKQGVTAERDRVEAWTVFAEVDPKAVAEGIAGGENISQKAMAEFSVKMSMNARMENHQSDNSDDTTPPAGQKTEAELKAEADMAAMNAEFEK